MKAYLSTFIALQCPLQLCTNWCALLRNCTNDNVRSGTCVVADMISVTVVVRWMNVFGHLGNGWNSGSQKKQVCLPQIPQSGAPNATSEMVCFSSNLKTTITQVCVFPGEEK